MSHSLWGILRLRPHCPSVSRQHGTVTSVKLFSISLTLPKFMNMEYKPISFEIHINGTPECKLQYQRYWEKKSETRYIWHLTCNSFPSLTSFHDTHLSCVIVWFPACSLLLLLAILLCLVNAPSELLGVWIEVFVCFSEMAEHFLFKLLSFTSVLCWNTQPSKWLLNGTVFLWLDRCYGFNGNESTGQHILQGSNLST